MMDRGYWANLARMPGLHPYSFERHPGIFYDHRVKSTLLSSADVHFM